MDPFFISYEVTEGENVVIDCATFQEAYHTGLLYEYGQVPPFELVPDGKKLMRKDQIFTINNVTARDEGIYYCVAKDKQLVEYERKAGEIILISCKCKFLIYLRVYTFTNAFPRTQMKVEARLWLPLSARPS